MSCVWRYIAARTEPSAAKGPTSGLAKLHHFQNNNVSSVLQITSSNNLHYTGQLTTVHKISDNKQNIRGGPCNYEDADKPCSTPLDHGHWWALKYALMRQWAQKPYDEQVDETFHYMPEFRDVTFAKCPQCGRTIYGMGHTLKKINTILQELPRCVDVSALSRSANVFG